MRMANLAHCIAAAPRPASSPQAPAQTLRAPQAVGATPWGDVRPRAEPAAGAGWRAVPTRPAPIRQAPWRQQTMWATGLICVGVGAVVLGAVTALQTPAGAAVLLAYEREVGPHAGRHSLWANLGDWAVVQGRVIGTQVLATGVILGGFLLIVHAERQPTGRHQAPRTFR